MDSPIFGGGKTKLDPETVKAARKALAAPCAVCASVIGIEARQLVPRKPQAFSIPASAAILVPLCTAHLDVDVEWLEAHLLACRMAVACESLGMSVDDL